MKPKLFIIDAHALCYRSFYAIRNLTSMDGQHTNAVYGFTNTLRKILKENNPDYMVVCFDSSRQTYRQEKFSQYKIQRPTMPDELRSQIPIIKDIVSAYNLRLFESPGYEADDIIATLVSGPYREALEIIIVSEDKDLYQLVGENVFIYSIRRDRILGYNEVKEILGFSPEKIVDYIGLAGDKTDNIPGVNGIGSVTAKKLIAEFGTLENIYANSEEIKSKKVQEKINEHKEMAFMSKELALLERNVDLGMNLHELKVKEPNAEDLFMLFKKLNFDRWSQELISKHPQKETIEIKSIKTKEDFQFLLGQIRLKGEFVFFLASVQEDLSGNENIGEGLMYLYLGPQEIYDIQLGHIHYLESVLTEESILKITYDIKSFLKVLERVESAEAIVAAITQVKVRKDFFDVMLAGYLLSSGESSFALGNLSWQYLKKMLPENGSFSNKVMTVYELYQLMGRRLKEAGATELFHEVEMPLAFLLFNIEKQGVNLDIDFLKDLSCDCEKKIKVLTENLFSMSGEEFNINSPKQLSHILFEKLKLPVIKKNKTGYSTNEEVLVKLAVQYEFPRLILDYRQLAKLKSTYIDALPKMLDAKTNRIHATFLQTGTETGRLSSRNPNLQNIPIRTELGRKVRKAFIPFAADAVLLKADYSQIELRILAHLSKDEELRKAFEKDEDVHRYTASLIFDIPENNVTKEMRNTAKRVNFGIIYGMSAFGLAKDLKIAQEEARAFIDRYFLRYKEVKSFMDKTIKICEEQGYVSTLLGRRRDIANINSSNAAIRQFAQRQAINTPVQGSAADLIKLAMINVAREMDSRQLRSKMIITVHDELVFNVFKTELKEMACLVKDKMETALTLSVPIKVSIKAGNNWLEMEEIDKPL